MTHDTPTPQAPETHAHPDVSSKDSFVLGIGFAWELGYSIAVPAVAFGLGGGWLDKQFHTSPLCLLVGLALAFVISFLIVAEKIKVINKRMPKDLPKKKKEPTDPDELAEHRALHDLFRPPSE